MTMLSLSKKNRYRIAVEKWTIVIASLWKLTIAEVYADISRGVGRGEYYGESFKEDAIK